MEKIEKLDLKHNYAESIANRMFVTGGLSSFGLGGTTGQPGRRGGT